MSSVDGQVRTMASSESTVQPNMDAGHVLRRSLSIAREDWRLSGVQLVAVLLSSIPFVGGVLQMAFTGLGFEFADETLGNSRSEESIGIRLVLSVIASIPVIIAVGIGLFIFIFPGIYLALKFSMVLPAIWLEDIGPIESLSESWKVTNGHLGTILGVEMALFSVGFAVMIGALVAFVPLTAQGLQAVNQQPLLLSYPALFGVQLLVAVTVGAVGTAAHALMYRSFSR